MKYENKLVNFNGHEWVWFRADQKTGNMCIDFSDGRHYGCLENFEESVEEKYGNNRNSIIYRTYMLEAEKLRLKLNLPARELKENISMIQDFKMFLNHKRQRIEEFLDDNDVDNRYCEKNKLWFDLALSNHKKNDDFQYLAGENNNFCYQDLVTVSLDIGNTSYNIAIPVSVLAEALEVSEMKLYESFFQNKKLDEDKGWI